MKSERSAHVHYKISDIEIEDWNRCANPEGEDYNPFIDARFLRALEESKSTCADTGWQPFHLRLSEGDQTVGVVPMYLKSHSRGEFVFDDGWAHALDSAGGRYYPKLQVSIPFTPATGRRLLSADKQHSGLVEQQLIGAAVKIAQKIGVSSLHMTFLPKNQWDTAGAIGLLQRIDTQFHWVNQGFSSFEDFLQSLSSKKRKNIRRERRGALSTGIEVECLTGSDLLERHWDTFFNFYMETGYRKWGLPYLTRSFFSLVSESMPERILLVLCKRAGRYIAGAINFIGGSTLYGRNWGCIEHHPFLHFETCYYQAIDYAIHNQLRCVEAGAQGSHKIARGYMPKPTYSVHWVHDPRLRDAVESFLSQERRVVQEDIEYIETRTPYKQTVNFDTYRMRV